MGPGRLPVDLHPANVEEAPVCAEAVANVQVLEVGQMTDGLAHDVCANLKLNNA